MSDTCSVTVEIHKDDADQIINMFGPPDCIENHSIEGVQYLSYSEINYAGEDRFEEICNRGYSFLVMHGRGDDYMSGAMASYNNDFCIVDCNLNGDPVIPIGPDGVVDARDRREVEKYWRLKESITAEFVSRRPTVSDVLSKEWL
jgi:hypothetical protein